MSTATKAVLTAQWPAKLNQGPLAGAIRMLDRIGVPCSGVCNFSDPETAHAQIVVTLIKGDDLDEILGYMNRASGAKWQEAQR